MIPEEQQWLLPGHEPRARTVVLTPRDVILPTGLVCYPDGSPRGFLVGPTRANLASLNPKEEPPVPRLRPHPCECGCRLPPWDSEDLSRLVGVNPTNFERHTALGDARWARAIYDAVMTSDPGR